MMRAPGAVPVPVAAVGVLVAGILLAGCSSAGDDGGVDESSATASASAIAVEGTTRPRVAWPDVVADRYSLVATADSGAVWSWEGTDTSVVLGGFEEVDAEGPGFAVVDGAELWLLAYDDDGSIVHSERLRISG